METLKNPNTSESTPQTLEAITVPRTIGELRADFQEYEQTGDFNSSVLGLIGEVPNAQELSSIYDFYKDKEDPFSRAVTGFITIDGGKLFRTADTAFFRRPMHNASGQFQPPSEAEADILDKLAPSLLLIDADFRKRAGITTEKGIATRPYIEFRTGKITDDERYAKNSLEHRAHTDGEGGEFGIMYFFSIGDGTLIYPGEFHSERISADARVDQINEQVKTGKINPVALSSGEIVAMGIDTVHASPQTEVGESRSFVRVLYELPK